MAKYIALIKCKVSEEHATFKLNASDTSRFNASEGVTVELGKLSSLTFGSAGIYIEDTKFGFSVRNAIGRELVFKLVWQDQKATNVFGPKEHEGLTNVSCESTFG